MINSFRCIQIQNYKKKVNSKSITVIRKINLMSISDKNSDWQTLKIREERMISFHAPVSQVFGNFELSFAQIDSSSCQTLK